MQLAHDYCEELTGAICLDALRLELMHETNEMRRRAYLLPKDSMVHKLPKCKHGEHQFAAYSADDVTHEIRFLDDDTNRILNFWAVPSFKEIHDIEPQISIFHGINHSNLYQFDLGDPEDKDEYGRPKLSEFTENKQHKLVKIRLPTVTPVDAHQAEAQFTNNQRNVDFSECYKFTGNSVLNYLYYLRQFCNLFDLEFFANKLPSKSFSIAGLEQCVLSGIPFWEDHEDGDDLSSDEYLDNQQVNDPMYADQSDAVDSPTRNQLALKVVQRVAEEKRAKLKLLQELELIKDKFIEWERHMRQLDLGGDIKQAGDFLNQIVQQNYYSLILVLQSIQDNHGTKGTALKEMHQILEV